MVKRSLALNEGVDGDEETNMGPRWGPDGAQMWGEGPKRQSTTKGRSRNLKKMSGGGALLGRCHNSLPLTIDFSQKQVHRTIQKDQMPG